MSKATTHSILFILATILFSSCAITPSVQVTYPWIRSMGHPEQIENHTNIYIDVIGEEEHLLLNNSFAERRVEDIVQNQLIRRNFYVVEDEQDADYTLTVIYSSRDIQGMRSEAFTYQSASQQNYSQTVAGVLAASAVGVQANRSLTSSGSSTATVTSYRHTLALEISTVDNEVIWTGESTWQSGSVEIINRIQPVTQKLISNLPGYGEVIPRVPAVISDKERNYYRLYISGNRFYGPSLPYIINLESSVHSSPSKSGLVSGVSDPRILAGVIDLLQTAEYAVPFNPDYSDPLSTDQWKRVRLGGEYYIGDDYQTSNIIVELRGRRDGYTISKASVVDQRTYNEFLDELAEWQNTLWVYFDVFE